MPSRAIRAIVVGALALGLPASGCSVAASHPAATDSAPAPSAGTIPSAPVLAPAARRLWGDWVADPGPLGLRDEGSRIQLSINWDGGRDVAVQTNYQTGTRVFKSNVAAAPDGQLRLVSQDTLDGCTVGDVGTYSWNRSADGVFLTLTLVADGCPSRSTTVARTWVHTLSAVTDGGRGVLPVDNLEVTLPNRRFGLGGADGAADLTTFDSSPFIEFLALTDPAQFGDPCSATDRKPVAGAGSVASVLAYVRGMPGFTFDVATASIGGNPATHLTGTPRPGFSCAAGEIGLFPNLSDIGSSWTIATGATLSVWVTENAGHAYLLWYHGDAITPADEAVVMKSLYFIKALPTP